MLEKVSTAQARGNVTGTDKWKENIAPKGEHENRRLQASFLILCLSLKGEAVAANFQKHRAEPHFMASVMIILTSSQMPHQRKIHVVKGFAAQATPVFSGAKENMVSERGGNTGHGLECEPLFFA
jgi:hypothetical protein